MALLTGAIFMGFVGTSLAQDDADPPAEPSAGIALNDDSATDLAIERRLRTILGEIEDFEQVTVEVNAGVVRLTGEVLEAGDIEDLETLVGRVEGVVTIETAVAETTDLSDRLTPAWDRFLSRLDQVIAYLPLLLVAVAVFMVIAVCGFVLAASRQPFERLAPNHFIADIYRQIVRIAFLLAGLVVALDILGAVALIGTLLGAAGLVGLAIGFAVRDTVENFVASIMLSVRQPFRPNDFVEIDGEQGNVIRLTSRATILLSPDGNHIRIPNATVFKSRILNFSRNPERRFEFDLGVDADADLAAAQAVGLKALGGLTFVLTEPPPATWVQAVGDSNVVVHLIGWIDQRKTDFLVARGEAIRVTKEALEIEGFGLPEPIYRLRFDGTGVPIVPESAPPPSPRRSPAKQSPKAVSADKDVSIEEKVEEERRREDTEDLLSPLAPEE